MEYIVGTFLVSITILSLYFVLKLESLSRRMKKNEKIIGEELSGMDSMHKHGLTFKENGKGVVAVRNKSEAYYKTLFK